MSLRAERYKKKRTSKKTIAAGRGMESGENCSYELKRKNRRQWGVEKQYQESRGPTLAVVGLLCSELKHNVLVVITPKCCFVCYW